MKKKILSLVLAFVVVLPCMFVLTACDLLGHKCDMKTEWSTSETHHWHECKSEECDLVGSHGEHDWNDGVVTTEATATQDGVKTFTCEVCGRTKTEVIESTSTARTTVTESEWNTIFDTLFDNDVTMVITDSNGDVTTRKYSLPIIYEDYEYYDDADGELISGEDYYVKDGSNYYRYFRFDTYDEGRWDRIEISEGEFNEVLGNDFFELCVFSEFTYNSTTNSYEREMIDGADVLNMFLTFTEGVLNNFSYEVNGLQYSAVFDYSDLELSVPETFQEIQSE